MQEKQKLRLHHERSPVDFVREAPDRSPDRHAARDEIEPESEINMGVDTYEGGEEMDMYPQVTSKRTIVLLDWLIMLVLGVIAVLVLLTLV